MNQRPGKRCVFVMRQKVNVIGDTIRGATKTISFVIKAENQADVNKPAEAFVEKRLCHLR